MSLIAQAIIAGFVLASAIVFGCLASAALITWILPEENDLAYDEDFVEQYAKRRGDRK
jgi:hypothetical protein